MKRLIEKCICFFATALMLLSATGAAATTVVLGYCNDEIKSTDSRDNLEYDAPIMGAVRFTSSQLAAYKGGKITKIRIGAEAGMSKTYVWVRPSLTEAAVTIKRLGTTADGWNEVTLDDPYTITGSEIYVGFNGTLPEGKNIILNGKTNSNGAFVAVDNQWEDLSTANVGSLLIQAVVEIDGEVNIVDMGIESLTADSKFAKNGDTRSFMATVGNYGTKAMTLPTLHYQIGNMPEQQVSQEKTIEPGTNYTVNFSAAIDNLPEGKNTMKVWMDVNDDIAENNEISSDIYAYTKSYPRKLLLEQFTTINCTNCPAGNRVLNKVVSGKDNVAWVAHHVGYGTDELTVSPSEDIMELGATSAPLAMIDRSMLALSENNMPTFSIGYTSETYGAQMVGIVYNQAALQPSFASVNINADYNEATRQLNITVSGEKNDDLYKLLYDNTALTVYLTEDNVKAEQVQTGGDANSYYHNHVLRQALTASFGDDIQWNGNTYTATYNTVLNDAWKPQDMKIVAFVSRKYEGNAQKADVLNTNDFSISPLTGIKGVNTADNATRRYFTLGGQQVNPADMQPKGVYIEQTQTAAGVQSKKIVME